MSSKCASQIVATCQIRNNSFHDVMLKQDAHLQMIVGSCIALLSPFNITGKV